jgi:carboxypeptidase Taq
MGNYEALMQKLADVNALYSAIAVLDWDQQCYMPSGGAEARAEHVGILSRMAHEQFTSEEVGSLIEKSRAEVAGDELKEATLRVVKRDYDLSTKLPTKLVEEKTRHSSISHEKWVTARKNNDFASFADSLAKMFDLARQQAEALGYKDNVYDPLLDLYEEGATAADATAMYEALKGPQVALVKAIAECPPPNDSFLFGDWDPKKQSEFTEMLVQAIGFDFNRGRQDVAPHPFCTGFSVGDIRLTTRFQDYLGTSVFGSLHEAGHGMYEQGSPMEWDRTPLAGGVSLGVHESQSRTWENIVGRSKSFWKYFLPKLQETFPEFKSVSLNDFYRAINKVNPSLIRVEADECTYNMHTMTRFELECDILSGKLAIKDVPDAWNAKYEAYLGVTPDSDANGCLQDVHWSGGLIGYFPTYTMGNLLSYQFWTALQKDLGDTDAMFEKGDFAPVLNWLREKIYSQGKRYTPKELVMRVTGKPMEASDYIAGLDKKYRELYSL